jgi:hypothetical protein
VEMELEAVLRADGVIIESPRRFDDGTDGCRARIRVASIRVGALVPHLM